METKSKPIQLVGVGLSHPDPSPPGWLQTQRLSCVAHSSDLALRGFQVNRWGLALTSWRRSPLMTIGRLYSGRSQPDRGAGSFVQGR